MRNSLIVLLILNLAYLGWILRERAQSLPLIETLEEATSGAPLVLLSEVDRALAGGSLPRCFRVGEFRSREDADRYIVEARALGLVARIADTYNPESVGFRLFIPPFADRSHATSNLKALQGDPAIAALEVESYLVTRGELENGIALGLYESFDAARAIQEKLNALGYPALVEQISAPEEPVFVLLQSADRSAISPAIWAQLTLDRAYLQRSENVC